MLPNKPLITLHSFLTWGNKACNLTVTVTVTVTNANQFITMNLDGSPAIPMTMNVNKSGGYLEVIVSEGVQLRLTWQVRSGLTGSVSVLTRLVSWSVRSGRRSGRIGLPPVYITVISDTLPSSVFIHLDIYIILSILALAWQFQSPIRWSH